VYGLSIGDKSGNLGWTLAYFSVEQNFSTTAISHTICRSVTKFSNVGGLANRNMHSQTVSSCKFPLWPWTIIYNLDRRSWSTQWKRINVPAYQISMSKNVISFKSCCPDRHTRPSALPGPQSSGQKLTANKTILSTQIVVESIDVKTIFTFLFTARFYAF